MGPIVYKLAKMLYKNFLDRSLSLSQFRWGSQVSHPRSPARLGAVFSPLLWANQYGALLQWWRLMTFMKPPHLGERPPASAVVPLIKSSLMEKQIWRVFAVQACPRVISSLQTYSFQTHTRESNFVMRSVISSAWTACNYVSALFLLPLLIVRQHCASIIITWQHF